jgi:hypothetical protein
MLGREPGNSRFSHCPLATIVSPFLHGGRRLRCQPPVSEGTGIDEFTTCRVTVEVQTPQLVTEYGFVLDGLSYTCRSNQPGLRTRQVDGQQGSRAI